MKTGRSGVAVVVTGTTPSPGVTVPVVVPVCGTVVVVGPAVVAKVIGNFFWRKERTKKGNVNTDLQGSVKYQRDNIRMKV